MFWLFVIHSVRWILIAPGCAFAPVFAMRAIGVLAYYYQDRMDLVTQVNVGEPAGLWPRFTSFLIDVVAVAVIAGLLLTLLTPFLCILTPFLSISDLADVSRCLVFIMWLILSWYWFGKLNDEGNILSVCQEG